MRLHLALGKWITVSGKKRSDYIFSGRSDRSSRPMTARQYIRLLKMEIWQSCRCDALRKALTIKSMTIIGHVFVPLDREHDGTVPTDNDQAHFESLPVPLALWDLRG
jgi:hypothetical protein